MDALRSEDLRGVMDAVGFQKAAVMGISEGGSLAALFAATYPQRCEALVFYGCFEIGRPPGRDGRRGVPESSGDGHFGGRLLGRAFRGHISAALRSIGVLWML